MAIEKWNPLGDLISLQDRMNNLLKEALGSASLANDRSSLAWSPPMDFFETSEAFLVVAELPGLKSGDIDIKIDDNTLILTAEYRAPARANKRNFFRKERSFGTCKRSFNLPSPVKTSAISANFKQGVLEVYLPKSTKSGGKALKVSIND